VTLQVDHFVKSIGAQSMTIYNIYAPDRVMEVPADSIVMATARQSLNSLATAAASLPVTVDIIGDATAPRSTYEAVFEGHRQARKI